MKKENVLIAAVVLAVCLLLGGGCLALFLSDSSSGKTIPLGKFVVQSQPAKALTKAEKLSGVSGQRSLENDTLLVKYEKNGDDTRSMVYNTKTGKTVGDFLSVVYEEEGVEYRKNFEISREGSSCCAWFWVKEEHSTRDPKNPGTTITYTRITLYDENGKEFAHADEGEPVFCYNLIWFDGDIWRIGENGPVLVKEDSEHTFSLSFDKLFFANDRYCIYDRNKEISVCDLDLKPIVSFTVPQEGNVEHVQMLNNGNLLVQYTLPCKEQEKDYTDFSEGPDCIKHYTLHTVLLNADRKQVKELDFPYFLDSLFQRDGYDNGQYMYLQENDINPAIENVAQLTPIGDIPEEGTLPSFFAIVSNEGKITKKITTPLLENVEYVRKVAANRWLVIVQDEKIVVNEQGKKLADWNYSITDIGYQEASGKIYDWKGTLLLDLDEKGLSVQESLNTGWLLRGEEEQAFWFDGTNLTALNEKNEEIDVKTCDNRLLMISGEKRSVIYNDLGAELFSIEKKVEFYEIYACEDYVLVSVRTERKKPTDPYESFYLRLS
ncbi:MAG: hypothetical protein IJX08_04740 [Clostridia bacterium]|nr:hypothetical protein [Clostridia bacterium]